MTAAITIIFVALFLIWVIFQIVSEHQVSSYTQAILKQENMQAAIEQKLQDDKKIVSQLPVKELEAFLNRPSDRDTFNPS